MKPILVTELKKQVIDIPKLVKIIVDGKPKKKWGFVDDGYEDVGLFTSFDNEGNNIFHMLATKGVLSKILPVIINNENTILRREKEDHNIIKKLIGEKNSQGLTPVNLAVSSNDPATLDLLHQNGINIISGSLVQYIFNKNQGFLFEIIKQEFDGLLELVCVQADMAGVLRTQVLNIARNIQHSNNVGVRKFFSTLFEFYWSDILVNNPSDKQIVSRLLEFINDYKDWGISKEVLAEIFDVKILLSEKAILGQVRLSILNKFAEDALNNRNLNITDDKIISKNFKDSEIFNKIVKFIMDGEKPKIDKPIEEKEEVEVVVQEIKLDVQQQVQKEDEIEQNPRLTVSLRELITDNDLVQEKKVGIHEYVAKVVENLKQSEKTVTYAKKYLGKEYTDLHLLIAISSHLKSKFDKVLSFVAEEIRIEAIDTLGFFKQYSETLENQDFLDVNSKQNANSYDLACIFDNLIFAKILLSKGSEIGIYTKNTNSIFEIAIANKSSNILKYLLTEQKLVELDWQFILSKAIKYANIQVAKFFVESGISAIEATADRKGVVKVGEKYTIFNKILDSLVELSEIERYKQEDYKKKAMVKIPALFEFLEVLLQGNKIYFSKESVVSKKTVNLLEKLKQNMGILKSQEVIKADFNLEKIINEFQENIPKIDKNFDIKSETTYVSHFSALSDIGHDDKTSIIGSDSSYIQTNEQQ